MITANYSDRGTPRFRVLTDEQCHEVFLAALECLERIGVLVANAEARALLAAAGARLDGNRAWIPPHIIHDALAAVPRAFTIWGRDHNRAIRVAQDRVHFGPGLTNTYFADSETGERRPTRRGDPALAARLADALPNIDYVMGLGLIGDVRADLASVYEFAELIANTGKPILAWAHRVENVAAIYRMAAAVAGGEAALQARPSFGFFATYASPLRHTDEDLTNILWAAGHDIPVIYIGGPAMGIEGPFSSASVLVLHLAAALSGLAIVQLKRRGAAMAIGGVMSAMDLRTARPAYGSPEMSLHCAAASDLARHLGVPFMGTAGATESKLLDAQAGAEAAIQVLLSALSGAALVHDAGFLDCADIGSLAMLALTDELVGMAKRILRGIEVNRSAIMLDLIEEIGPGGHFLDEPRSASLARKEVWVPTLFDRAPHVIWEQKGAKDTAQRTSERVRTLLNRHQPQPLPDGAAEAIQVILDEVEALPPQRF